MKDNLDLPSERDKKDYESIGKDSLEINDDKKKEESIKNESNEVNGKKTPSPIINKRATETNLDNNKEKTNKDLSIKINNEKVIDGTSADIKIKPKKEIPIEKKPFNEFINDHLLPSLIEEFKERGFEVGDINLKNTSRPIAGDKCWVIYCEIKDTCNFWLSFEKDDISSLKSISLCKSSQKPSVIESFLIDEKRITLKLIISRILQRLNGQKLIGIN